MNFIRIFILYLHIFHTLRLQLQIAQFYVFIFCLLYSAVFFICEVLCWFKNLFSANSYICKSPLLQRFFIFLGILFYLFIFFLIFSVWCDVLSFRFLFFLQLFKFMLHDDAKFHFIPLRKTTTLLYIFYTGKVSDLL